MNPLIRAYEARVDDINNAERSIVAKISTQDIDRYKTVFLSRGCDLTAYNRNKVVLWCHGKDPQRGERPIGKNLWIRVDRGSDPKIIAKTVFNDDEFSQQLFRDYQNGFLNAWSISALPLEHSRPTQEEIRSFPSWSGVEMVYRKFEILEYSSCGVPGNSSCTSINESEVRDLSEMVTRGYYIFPEVRVLVDQANEPDEVAPIIERMSESDGMASGGALVADDDEDEADEPDGDDDDDAVPPKKKKKKKKAKERSADDESDDSIAMSADEVETVADEPEATADEVTRDAPEVETQAEIEVVEVAAETVERSAPEPEPVVVAVIESKPEPVAAPTPEPEPVDPFAGLPPLVGRSLEDIARGQAATIEAWRNSVKTMFSDIEAFSRGEA